MQINHKVPLIRQGLLQCVQASTAQLLQAYGIQKTIEEIREEVPVYISSLGIPLGSSLGHIASYMITQGYQVTIHTVDTEIFDKSWESLTKEEIVLRLKERRKYVRHSRYEEEALNAIFDGYIQFLKSDGKIIYPIVDERYIVELLKKGPVFCVVNYNFLNEVARGKFDRKTNAFVRDSIAGSPSTHAVVIAGYDEGVFTIVDPDSELGGVRKFAAGHLLGAFYLAQTDFDCILITLQKSSQRL